MGLIITVRVPKSYEYPLLLTMYKSFCESTTKKSFNSCLELGVTVASYSRTKHRTELRV